MIKITNEERINLADELAYLNLPILEKKGGFTLKDPFADITFREESMRFAMLDILSDPDNFWLTCKLLLNVDIPPIQQLILKTLWTKARPMLIATRGFSKTYMLALLIILKCVFVPGIRIIVVALGLRQSKQLYDYVERIWKHAPLLKQMAGATRIKGNEAGPRPTRDSFVFKFGDSQAEFLPLGPGGATIRGKRANLIIIDEYGDVPKDVIDTVVVGFGAVSSDPVVNVKMRARVNRWKRKGQWDNANDELFAKMSGANQIIVAGTAKFYFNHFAQEWEKYKSIILSRGDKSKMLGVDSQSMKYLDHRDYAIIRIPHQLVPEGFMDEKMIEHAKQSVSLARYHQEYCTVFSKDTNGFFNAQLIYELCTANRAIYRHEGDERVLVAEPYNPMLRGDPDKQYVLGFDPANFPDNAAFVVLEIHGNHIRVVYCWSTNEKEFKEMSKKHKDLGTYYQYCASKIIELRDRFNIELICMDWQGGGREIGEILAKDIKVLGNRMPLFPICNGHPLWDSKERETDRLTGRHIIEPVQFSNAAYTSDAHHSLKSDLEKCRIIFPAFDAIKFSELEAFAPSADFYNSMEDCMMEIQKLKTELTIIEYSISAAGRERWDTPETKNDDGLKGHLTNDRMSALVMANYGARRISNQFPQPQYKPSFGSVGAIKHVSGQKWANAPEWVKNPSYSMGNFRVFNRNE